MACYAAAYENDYCPKLPSVLAHLTSPDAAMWCASVLKWAIPRLLAVNYVLPSFASSAQQRLEVASCLPAVHLVPLQGACTGTGRPSGTL